MYSSILHAQQIIAHLEKARIKSIVISPGSRNAPLTLGFNHNSYFNCYSIVDERCAAHVALGMAQQLREPVVLVCTSGSALLNYYPAVAEAFYSEIPLIILSADRPPHKIDIGDGQTIRQEHVYSNHIINDGVLHMIESINDQKFIDENNSIINRIVTSSIVHNGPVHINIPFEEPLYNLVEKASIQVPEFEIPQESYIQNDFAEFNDQWERSTKKLVLISTLDPDVLNSQDIAKVLQDPTVLVMTEVSANQHHENIVWSIDTLLAPIEKNETLLNKWRPEIVVTIGGMIVSKKVKQQLRAIDNLYHYHVGENRVNDTFFCVKGHFQMPPSLWIDQLNESNIQSDYQDYWVAHFKNCIIKKQKYLKNASWSDFKVFKKIFNELPDHMMLQLGNSSTVRYAQLFKMNPTHQIFSNRGTSGIDGSTSTAIGAAMVSNRPTICLTGDISFLYDSNALWNNYIPKDFKIILINNSGGGIFRILPGHEDDSVFDTYFETQHQLTAQHLCKMFGFNYEVVVDEHAFAKALPNFLKQNSKPQLLEVMTPNDINDKVLLDYFKFLR